MEIPSDDLVTWTLNNQKVAEDELIYVDAVHPDRYLTKQKVRSLVKQLVAGLHHENGSQALNGDVVCLHSFNDILYPVLFLGIVGAGGMFTGTNPAYTSSELSHHFRISKTKFIVTQTEHLPQILPAAKACDIPVSRIFLFNPRDQPVPDGFRGWTELLQHGKTDWITFGQGAKSIEVTAALSSTSGTTGSPKMVMQSHRSFVAESIALNDQEQKSYKERRLLCIPFFHAFASPLCHIAPLRNGVLTYVMRRFDESDFLHAVEQYNITETALVPPIIVKFLANPAEQHQKLRNLRLVWCAGAPFDPLVQQKAKSMFSPDVRITQVWGMTECGWITTFMYPESDDTGSVGRLIPGWEAKLVSHDGTVVEEAGGTGEMYVRGPTPMRGYLNNPEATVEALDKHGWFRTGDVAFLREGKVYIVDRVKELIKVRGWQVAPAELEGFLLMHDAIADAAVIGVVLSDGMSEVPRAYIVRKRDQVVQADSIRQFLLGYLAKYKVGDCQVVFCDEIPKSSSGKILKKVLRANAMLGTEKVE